MDKDSVSPLPWTKLYYYYKGSRRVAVTQKKNLGIKLTEGKRAISFRAYKLLESIIFKSDFS